MPIAHAKKPAESAKKIGSGPKASKVKWSPRIEMVDVEKLLAYPGNVKTHPQTQVDLLASAISEYGFTVPVLADAKGTLVAGHCRLMAARKLGLSAVPCVRLEHLSAQQVRKLRLLDNKLAEFGDTNLDTLREELAAIDDKELSALFGMDDLDLGLIPDADPDDVPETNTKKIVTKKGDVWKMGDHLLLCGDALDQSAVFNLLGGGRADMVFTDPPYLMDFQGGMHADGTKSTQGKKIANDDLSLDSAEGKRFMDGFCASVRANCKGAWYMTFYRLGIDSLFASFERSGLKWRNMVIWKKDNLNLSNSDYKALHEPMLVGWADDWAPVFYGWEELHEFYGKKGEVDVWDIPLPSVWEIAKTKKNDLHPTMKPVALVERCIKNSSKPGQTVLDLFGGSGTTVIACERTNRKARVVEMEPVYCDVIVKRWEEFTGKKAERITKK